MFNDIAYYQILGFSVIALLGITTYSLFALTGLIAYMSKKGKKFIPFKWHSWFAVVAIIMATVHALLVILSKYF